MSMTTTTTTATTKKEFNWLWSKPVHWADICRAQMMLNDLTSNQIRKRLLERIESGEVVQIKRGLYRLARKPN